MTTITNDATSPENPFRPGSELQRETDELMRRSVFQRDHVYIPDDLAAPSAPTTPLPTLSRPESNGSQKHVRIKSNDGATDFLDGPNAPVKNGIGQSEVVEQVSASKASGDLQSAAPNRNNSSANGDVAAGAKAAEKLVQKKRKHAACCPVS